MTTNDWITLFIPVVCNGILIYIMQTYMKYYFEKKDRLRIQNNSILKQLVECLEDLQQALYLFAQQQFDSHPERFQKYFNDIASDIHKMKQIADANAPFYEELYQKLFDIFDIWNSITHRVESIISEQKGMLTSADDEFLNNNFCILYKSVCTLHSYVIKKIW